MVKTDKELAVEVLCAYLRAGYGPPTKKVKEEDTSGLSVFLNTAYKAIHELPDENQQENYISE